VTAFSVTRIHVILHSGGCGRWTSDRIVTALAPGTGGHEGRLGDRLLGLATLLARHAVAG